MPTDNQLITFMMSREMYLEIQRQKKRQNKSQAAIYREAIAAWLESEAGVIVDPTMPNGGYRGRKAEKVNAR
jgi:hypothetical protein